MPYAATSWVNGTTPINATNLNKLEAGVAVATNGIINIKEPAYGAVGNGTTDDSAAFVAAYAAVVAARDSGQTGYFGANVLGQRVIELPPGTYKIVTPGALMSDLGIGRSNGLTIRGPAGRGTANIVFSPTSADQYLMNNNEDWLGITFEDVNFHSTVATASFMKSVSDGGPQNIVFNRCAWTGTWKYGIDLQGTNNNSEFTFFHCGVYADWAPAFFYIGTTSTSDQFLNYNFIGCNVEYAVGNFIDIAKGGNINVWGGSFIHTGAGAATQTFFALRGGDHASGVCRLLVQGIRVEHRHELSELIYCEWKTGNIAFRDCDTDSYQFLLSNPENVIQAEFRAQNTQGPQVLFDACTLMGKHKYGYYANNYQKPRMVTYQGCEIFTFADAHDFIVNEAVDATSNTGSVWPIMFDKCRGGLDNRPVDCTINRDTSVNAQLTRFNLAFQNQVGSLPTQSATIDTWLPMGAIITDVRFYKASGGASSSTTYTYPLKTSEGSPTTIATGTGTIWSGGFNSLTSSLWFVCDSDVKRHVTLTPTNITEEHSSSVCIITYLA